MGETSFKLGKGCFYYRELGHFKTECPWIDHPCRTCKEAPMRLFFCKEGVNKGRGFFKCSTQPKCNAFQWLDSELEKMKAAMKDEGEDEVKLEKLKHKEESKVKLTIKGKVEITFERNVQDVCQIVETLELN